MVQSGDELNVTLYRDDLVEPSYVKVWSDQWWCTSWVSWAETAFEILLNRD